MVKHLVLWKLKEELSEEEKKQIKADIKNGLEGLKGQISGLIDIKVHTKGLTSSTTDLMLNSSFEDEAALKVYRTHPAHIKVANTNVRPYIQTRTCFDFEQEIF